MICVLIDVLLLLSDNEFRIDTLIFALHIVQSLVDDIALALFDQFPALRFALVEIVLVDFVSEVADHEICDHEHTGEPNDKSEKMKHYVWFLWFSF